MQVEFITENKQTAKVFEAQLTMLSAEIIWRVTNKPSKKAKVIMLADDILTNQKFLNELMITKSEKQFVIGLSLQKSSAFITQRLEDGVDCFWEQNSDPAEFVARLYGILRWFSGSHELALEFDQGQLALYDRKKQIFLNGHELALTKLEYELFRLLAVHPNRIYSREELLLLSQNERGSSRAVDTHIKNIRRKLAELNADKNYIQTVHGRGYRFVAN